MTPGQILRNFIYPKSVIDWENLNQRERNFYEEATQIVLDSQWRSVDDPPENIGETVILCGGMDRAVTWPFSQKDLDRTHWMPIPKPPKPKELTPLDKSRAEFEKWAKEYFTSSDTERRQDIAWQAWRAAKEL
jgi:hypothetical protein